MSIVTNLTQLNKPTKRVEDLKAGEAIASTLFQYLTMKTDGIGLAAPQVHLNHKMFIFRNPDKNIEDDKIEITALINPEIKKLTDETNDAWEGCLSIPGMLGLVRRFDKIRYSGYDVEGNIIEKEVSGDKEIIKISYNYEIY